MNKFHLQILNLRIKQISLSIFYQKSIFFALFHLVWPCWVIDDHFTGNTPISITFHSGCNVSEWSVHLYRLCFAKIKYSGALYTKPCELV
jgi:hypothetical protein